MEWQRPRGSEAKVELNFQVAAPVEAVPGCSPQAQHSSKQRPAALQWGQMPKIRLSTLIVYCRSPPPCASGRKSGGRRAGNRRVPSCSLPPVCAPSCCSGRRSQLLVNTTTKLPPSCPPRIRHTLFHEPDTGSALQLSVFIERLYFTQQFSALFPSFSVATCRRRQAALALPAPGADRVQFCAALLSRPHSPTTSLAPLFFGSPQAQPHGRRWPQVIPRRLWRRRAHPRPRWTPVPATSRAPSASPKTRTPMATRRI